MSAPFQAECGYTQQDVVSAFNYALAGYTRQLRDIGVMGRYQSGSLIGREIMGDYLAILHGVRLVTGQQVDLKRPMELSVGQPSYTWLNEYTSVDEHRVGFGRVFRQREGIPTERLLYYMGGTHDVYYSPGIEQRERFKAILEWASKPYSKVHRDEPDAMTGDFDEVRVEQEARIICADPLRDYPHPSRGRNSTHELHDWLNARTVLAHRRELIVPSA